MRPKIDPCPGWDSEERDPLKDLIAMRDFLDNQPPFKPPEQQLVEFIHAYFNMHPDIGVDVDRVCEIALRELKFQQLAALFCGGDED